MDIRSVGFSGIKKDRLRRIVAMVGRKRIGYLDWYLNTDASKGRGAELEYLTVLKQYRRRGIAETLMQAALAAMARIGVEWVGLWTGLQCELDGSWKLYEKLGFKQAMILADYYRADVPTRYFVLHL